MKRWVTVLVLLVTASLVPAVPAAAVEVRQFIGEGSSDFGLQLIYARAYAQRQATEAGFTDCTEIETVVWPYSALVVWECTR